ncbi:MAG: thioredoxin [Phycisphaerales bacterium]|nr:MAG: thioredoxin [Phycisphaerales bacterium]
MAHLLRDLAPLLVLLPAITLLSCAATPDHHQAKEERTEPPPAIRAWMDRLTVPHEYDPETGFIVARQTIALPAILTDAPRLDEALEQASRNQRLVIAFATADRCAPCQQYKKDALNDERVLARLADPRLLPTHVEVDREPALADAHLGGRAIPMTYALRHGRVTSTLRGQRSPEELLHWLETVLAEAL